MPSLSSNRLRKNAKKIFSKVPGACPYQAAALHTLCCQEASALNLDHQLEHRIIFEEPIDKIENPGGVYKVRKKGLYGPLKSPLHYSTP